MLITLNCLHPVNAATDPPTASEAPSQSVPDPIVLPYQPLVRHGAPLLSLGIDGHPNQWFLVDTGAPGTWLSGDIADRLRLTTQPYMDEGKALIGTDGKPLRSANVQIQMGPITFPIELPFDMAGIRDVCRRMDTDEAEEGKSITVSGLIGTNVLVFYSLEIDPDRQEVRLSTTPVTDAWLERSGFVGGVAAGIPLTFDQDRNGKPYVSVTIETQTGQEGKAKKSATVSMILDTGSYQTAVTAEFASQFSRQSLVSDDMNGQSGALPIDIHADTTVHVGSVSLNQFACGVIRTGATPASPQDASRLGMDFLSHFRTLVDLRSHRMYLQPLASTQPYGNPSLRANATKEIHGMVVQPAASGDWYVKALRPDSSFAKSGIAVADQILMADGVALAGRLPTDVGSRLLKVKVVRVQRSVDKVDTQVDVHLPTSVP